MEDQGNVESKVVPINYRRRVAKACRERLQLEGLGSCPGAGVVREELIGQLKRLIVLLEDKEADKVSIARRPLIGFLKDLDVLIRSLANEEYTIDSLLNVDAYQVEYTYSRLDVVQAGGESVAHGIAERYLHHAMLKMIAEQAELTEHYSVESGTKKLCLRMFVAHKKDS